MNVERDLKLGKLNQHIHDWLNKQELNYLARFRGLIEVLQVLLLLFSPLLVFVFLGLISFV